MNSNKHLFVSVEGPIGAGKTSLTQLLSKQYNLVMVKEIVDENPFLSKFYGNIEEYAFQTEMFFLCNRLKQLEDIQLHYINNNVSIVSDYHIFKNKLFANINLNEDKLSKYDQIFDVLMSDLPQPNVVIYIRASLETLLSRISKRGRVFEMSMDPRYLERLIEEYDRYIDVFKELFPHIPVIELNGDEIDYVQNLHDSEKVFAMFEAKISSKEGILL